MEVGDCAQSRLESPPPGRQKTKALGTSLVTSSSQRTCCPGSCRPMETSLPGRGSPHFVTHKMCNYISKTAYAPADTAYGEYEHSIACC